MKRLVKISLLFSVVFSGVSNAQMITKRDTIGGTPLVISMDAKINEALENADNNCDRIAASSESSVTSKPKVTVPTTSTPKSKAEICRENPKMMGYKIQLAVVKSNEEAKEVGMYFRRRFPNMKVEIDASLRPNYKVLTGSYFTKQSAATDLKKVREFFDNAIAIQYRIFCVEAK